MEATMDDYFTGGLILGVAIQTVISIALLFMTGRSEKRTKKSTNF